MKSIYSHLEDKAHIIWDWNGTLLKDIDHAVEVVNRLLREENLSPITVDEYKQIFGFPVLDYYKKLGFDTSPDSFHDLCERFNLHFHSGLETCGLWPGVRETLARVHAAGKFQSVLSASEQLNLNNSIRLFKLEEYFHHVVGIHDKKAGSKVARGRELMARVNIPASQTILIGDTDHDLEVGEALGIEVILVEHGHQCPTRLRAIHKRVVNVLD